VDGAKEIDRDGSDPPADSMRGKKRGAMHLKRSTRQPSCSSVRFERLNASAFSRCSDLP